MLEETRDYEFVVIGAGMAGLTAAVTAARRGLRTALIGDRPVLGGNGSKEVRVWLHGANGGENNRYFRETGLMEELRLENLYRNPLGNAELWDTVLLDAVVGQENLDLYLNTVVTEVEMASPQWIAGVSGFTLASERRWSWTAPLFADCTGDGTVAFLAGAEFRTGRESRHEFGEQLAPERAEPYTLGGTLLFALKDAGRPVPFAAPRWAHCFTEEDLRHRAHRTPGTGHEYWWIEWGGELDTVHDHEAIRHELLRIVYGIIDHLKNAPEHADDMAHYTLEWVGAVPGKRESRRFLGDYLLTEADLLEQPAFEDAVAIGGWNIDHHPPRGIFSPEPPSFHFHLPGVYNIPFRCLYARDVDNLLLAGRNASATHVAMCSTRVMLTGAQMGEAIGAAAFQCRLRHCAPRDLVQEGGIYALQQELLKYDHAILDVRNEDPHDLARTARVTESSFADAALERRDGDARLDRARALMLPLAGKLEHVELLLQAEVESALRYALHAPNERGNFIPGPVLSEGEVRLPAGTEPAWTPLPVPLGDAEPGFYWLLLRPEDRVRVGTTRERLAGVLSYVHAPDWKPDQKPDQKPDPKPDWKPEPEPEPWPHDRRHRNPFSPWRKMGENLCFRTDAWIPAFYGGDQVTNGVARTHRTPSIWVSAPMAGSKPEWIELSWDTPREIGAVYLYFNTDLDRDLRNIWQEQAERVIPECVRHYRVLAWGGTEWRELAEVRDNYQRFRIERFPAVRTERLRVEILGTNGDPRAQLYQVRVYGPEG